MSGPQRQPARQAACVFDEPGVPCLNHGRDLDDPAAYEHCMNAACGSRKTEVGQIAPFEWWRWSESLHPSRLGGAIRPGSGAHRRRWHGRRRRHRTDQPVLSDGGFSRSTFGVPTARVRLRGASRPPPTPVSDRMHVPAAAPMARWSYPHYRAPLNASRPIVACVTALLVVQAALAQQAGTSGPPADVAAVRAAASAYREALARATRRR